MSKKNADIYREAAEMVDCGAQEFSCMAVKRVMSFEGHYGSCPQVRAYSDIFDLEGSINTFGCLWKMPKVKAAQIRVLMLCLMAAIEEAGDTNELLQSYHNPEAWDKVEREGIARKFASLCIFAADMREAFEDGLKTSLGELQASYDDKSRKLWTALTDWAQDEITEAERSFWDGFVP